MTTAPQFRVPFRHGRPIAPAPVAWSGRLARAWVRLAVRAPHGLWRLLKPTLAWISDWDGRPPKVARGKADPEGVEGDARHKTKASHLESILRRCALAAFVVVMLAVGWLLAWNLLTHLQFAVIVAAVLTGLGWIAPRDAPVLDLPPTPRSTPTLTGDFIIDCLYELGVPNLTANLASPVINTRSGWTVDVDLNVPASSVTSRVELLATHLVRPAACVHAQPVPSEHPGRVRLDVLRRAPDTGHTTWPVLTAQTVSVYEPTPIGQDIRGEQYTLDLVGRHGIVGGVTGHGKTSLVSEIAIPYLLDVSAQAYLIDCMGSGDYAYAEAAADGYVAGNREQDMRQAVELLDWLVGEEMPRRIELLANLPAHLKPDGAATQAVAAVVPPTLVVVDECQRLFTDTVHGRRGLAAVEQLCAQGRKVGMSGWSITQHVNSSSLPRPITANATIRVCGPVVGHDANDEVLGPGSWSRGVRGTGLKVGQWIIVAPGRQPTTVITPHIDVASRMAAGQRAAATRPAPPERPRTLTADLLAAWPQPEITPKLWTATLLACLQRHWPGDYDQWTPGRLGAALNQAGAPTKDVKLAGQTRKGVDLDALRAATRDATLTHAGRYQTQTGRAW